MNKQMILIFCLLICCTNYKLSALYRKQDKTLGSYDY